MKFLKIPYKYLFLNKKRTFISALSLFVSCIIVAIGYGWIDGMIENLINSHKNIQTGNIRIVNKDFLKYEKFKSIEYTVENSSEIKENLFNILDNFFINKPKNLKNFQILERLKFNGFVGKENNTALGQIYGIQYDKEKERFKLEKSLISGSANILMNEIIIAEGLAKKLNLKENDEIIISCQTYEGGLNAKKYKVKGIIKLSLSMLNKSAIFMNIDDAKNLIKLDKNSSIEILLFFNNNYTETLTKKIKDELLKENNIKKYENIYVQNLYENMGLLYSTYYIAQKVMYILFFFIVFLASFVIINTMMMNIFERINEIGTMKALGFTDKQIFFLHILEGTMMGALGGIPGAFVGYILTYIMNYYGLDFSYMMSNIDFLMDTLIRPKASIDVLILTIILSIITPAIATIIPSNYARKLNPNEALKHL